MHRLIATQDEKKQQKTAGLACFAHTQKKWHTIKTYQ